MLNRKKNNKGFTLVELLVVIAIIGILAVVAVPALFKNIEKGKVADLEADISAIKSAALSVYADTSNYPSGTVTGTAGTAGTAGIDKELEGLSKPFGATYNIESAQSQDADASADGTTKALKKGDIVLTITTTSQIGKNGISKLEQDLGDSMLTKLPANSSGTTTIKIKLSNKN